MASHLQKSPIAVQILAKVDRTEIRLDQMVTLETS